MSVQQWRTSGDQAPTSHFFMKLFLAAPASFLPSALTALVAQASAMHFFMNEVFAAPASALPSLPIALLSQDVVREGRAGCKGGDDRSQENPLHHGCLPRTK